MAAVPRWLLHAKRAERIAAVRERWALRFADLGEVAVYCPKWDEREFGIE